MTLNPRWLSVIEGRRFFVAYLFGRLPMILLLTLVGAYGLTITPAMIAALTGIGLLMLAAWLYTMRERPDEVRLGAGLPDLTG